MLHTLKLIMDLPIRTFKKQTREIKNSENVILFADNYQRPEIQVLADVIGDSLEFS